MWQNWTDLALENLLLWLFTQLLPGPKSVINLVKNCWLPLCNQWHQYPSNQDQVEWLNQLIHNRMIIKCKPNKIATTLAVKAILEKEFLVFLFKLLLTQSIINIGHTIGWLFYYFEYHSGIPIYEVLSAERWIAKTWLVPQINLVFEYYLINRIYG